MMVAALLLACLVSGQRGYKLKREWPKRFPKTFKAIPKKAKTTMKYKNRWYW